MIRRVPSCCLATVIPFSFCLQEILTVMISSGSTRLSSWVSVIEPILIFLLHVSPSVPGIHALWPAWSHWKYSYFPAATPILCCQECFVFWRHDSAWCLPLVEMCKACWNKLESLLLGLQWCLNHATFPTAFVGRTSESPQHSNLLAISHSLSPEAVYTLLILYYL